MYKPLKIYLGDLTYDTVAISTEAAPLNVGFIASYCLEKFGDKVEITLFKYIADLENAIIESPPDVLGLSNYCWSQNVSYEMFKLLSKNNPRALIKNKSLQLSLSGVKLFGIKNLLSDATQTLRLEESIQPPSFIKYKLS